MLPRILWLFVDGIGLGPQAGSNPFAIEPTPALRALLGGPLTVERVGAGAGWSLAALDAALGVAGLPQSATGQTALFTGENAPALLGRHATAFPGPRLRAVLAEHSVLRRAAAAGRQVTFANPFTPRYWEMVEARERRLSATTCAVLASGARLRDLGDLRRDEAVTWDVCRDHFGGLAGEDLPPVPALDAGRHLAGLLADHDLVLWETFITDLAGHHRFGFTAAEALRRVDGLLGGALAALPADATLIVTSDHGNLEDASHTRHTRNPVPLLAVGPLAAELARAQSLLDVTPAVLRALGVAPS